VAQTCLLVAWRRVTWEVHLPDRCFRIRNDQRIVDCRSQYQVLTGKNLLEKTAPKCDLVDLPDRFCDLCEGLDIEKGFAFDAPAPHLGPPDQAGLIKVCPTKNLRFQNVPFRREVFNRSGTGNSSRRFSIRFKPSDNCDGARISSWSMLSFCKPCYEQIVKPSKRNISLIMYRTSTHHLLLSEFLLSTRRPFDFLISLVW
jgi:hypothetical protein